jgi:hypothetical protein
MAAYGIRSSAIYNIKKQKDQLQAFMPSSDSVNGLLKWYTLKQPYDKAL